MKRLFVVFIAILILASCCTINMGFGPKYTGVDKRAKTIYDEYINLSSYKHIAFKGKVSIGFTHIKEPGVVGECAIDPNYREITVDIDYWNYITKLQRLELLFHELTHCFCGRNHDYGEGASYLEITNNTDVSPFFSDGCPVSIMYPRVLKNDCIKEHYGEYVEEMFDHCEQF